MDSLPCLNLCDGSMSAPITEYLGRKSMITKELLLLWRCLEKSFVWSKLKNRPKIWSSDKSFLRCNIKQSIFGPKATKMTNDSVFDWLFNLAVQQQSHWYKVKSDGFPLTVSWCSDQSIQQSFGTPGQTKVSGDRQRETTHEICCLVAEWPDIRNIIISNLV